MRKISLWLFIFVFTASLARAQDAATQEQLDKLSGQIQDLQVSLLSQDKRIQALEKQIADLGDKVNQPAANDSASADDLKKLAAQVQEIDKKRQDDNALILRQLEKLAKVGGASTTGHKSPPAVLPAATTAAADASPGAKQSGYDYTIAPGDTVSAIAKAYHAQGVKVTTAQILAANPGLNPNSLIVGKKIFIPDANAK
jgi:septal ring factor EnvC (AmiA/AmiB activator)